jgi:hypothetical protein
MKNVKYNRNRNPRRRTGVDYVDLFFLPPLHLSLRPCLPFLDLHDLPLLSFPDQQKRLSKKHLISTMATLEFKVSRILGFAVFI